MPEKLNSSKKGKPLTIFITGGSSGIGYQAALKLISLGHNMILPCKNISRANELLTNIFNQFDQSEKTINSNKVNDVEYDFSSQIAVGIRKATPGTIIA